MSDPIFRASSIHRLMTSPRTKSDGPLSVGAKTYIKELAAQNILGVQFWFSSKETKKGLMVEQEAIEMLSEVRGELFTKNEERRTVNGLTGECDIIHGKHGIDIKCPWSPASYPLTPREAHDTAYEWQARAYMHLWDADTWEVAFCLMDTPAELLFNEPLDLHIVSHIDPKLRITSVKYERDLEKEQLIFEKIAFAKEHYQLVVAEFMEHHK